MLILILIDVQYSQKAVSNFEKGSNYQNHSSLCSLYRVKKKFLPVKFTIPTPTGRREQFPVVTAIWKTGGRTLYEGTWHFNGGT